MTDHDETRHIPSDEELTAARRSLDAMLGGHGLDQPEIWAEPPAGLESDLMATVAGEQETPVPQRDLTVLESAQPERPRWVAPAAIAAAVIAVVAALTLRPTSPDWEVALGATPEAGRVEAVVLGWNEPSGTRVELDISGLGAAPEGFIYELWFSNGANHVSAGTFQNPADVTLWAGVSRRDFPRVWITLEPLDDGDPGPGVNLLDTDV